METEARAQARQHAQDAMIRARTATDPDTKRKWQDVAKVWLGRLADFERTRRQRARRTEPTPVS